MQSRRAVPPVLLGLFVFLAAPAQGAERYRIDPLHTFALYEYSHWGLSRQQGRFDEVRGFVTLDPAAPGGGEVDLEIAAASVHSGNAGFDETLRGEDYFDVANHPTIMFRAKHLEFDGDALTRVHGELSIKGVSRPLSLAIDHYRCRFMPLYLRRACGANGSASLSRSDFGLGRYAPLVADEVVLRFAVEAIHE